MTSFGLTVAGLAAAQDLLSNIKTKFEGGTVYVVGPEVEYAVYQEFGTADIEARPFARPAAERVQSSMASRVDEFLDEDVAEAGEEAVVRAAALAVESEMKEIIISKEIIDTGTLLNSVGIERVQ